MRRIILILSLAAVAAVAAAVGAATAFSGGGPTSSQLANADWTCFVPVTGDNLHCAPPGGLGRVLSGEAETMTFLVFREPDGLFLGTELIVRDDVFAGQPCPTDPPSREYTDLKPILELDYWACHRYDSGF